MSKMATAATTLTPGERDYVRRERDMFFSTYPSVAGGFQLKTWRGGPQAGQPKLPPPAQTLLERGLMRLDTGVRPPRLFFTDAGLVELRAMMADRRFSRLGLCAGPFQLTVGPSCCYLYVMNPAVCQNVANRRRRRFLTGGRRLRTR
jgi:hypothetical protein